MKKHTTAFAILSALFLGSAIAEEQTICPMMVDTEIDKSDEGFVEYKGVTVWMCCGSCTSGWEDAPDYYLKVALEMDLLPQFADQKEALEEELKDIELMAQRFCPLRPESVISPKSAFVEYEGKKIYFFKERDIERRWAPDPAAKFAEARAAGLLPQFDEAPAAE
ncbi:MAG: hypothetical protein AAGH89_11125 [Verrucomicrobiota bacterium]